MYKIKAVLSLFEEMNILWKSLFQHKRMTIWKTISGIKIKPKKTVKKAWFPKLKLKLKNKKMMVHLTNWTNSKASDIGPKRIQLSNVTIASNSVTSQKVAQMKQKRKVAFYVEKTLMNHSTALKKCASSVTKLVIKLVIAPKRTSFFARNATK